MTTTTSSNSAGSTAAGNPVAVAARVEAIEMIAQVRGSFVVAPAQEGWESQSADHSVQAQAEMAGVNQATVLVEVSAALHSVPTDVPETDALEKPQVVTFRASATFLIVYRFSVGPKPSNEDLQAFAAANGVFNAWPYWREFLGNVLMRAGFPPSIAPVLKLGQEAQPTKPAGKPASPRG